MVRIVSILAAIWFVSMGVPKLFGMTLWAVQFEGWGYPLWFMLVIGIIESVCGMLLLVRKTVVPAAAVLIAVMIGAGITHAINFEGLQVVKPTLSIIVLLWLILKNRGQRRQRKAAAE